MIVAQTDGNVTSMLHSGSSNRKQIRTIRQDRPLPLRVLGEEVEKRFHSFDRAWMTREDTTFHQRQFTIEWFLEQAHLNKCLCGTNRPDMPQRLYGFNSDRLHRLGKKLPGLGSIHID